MSEMVLQSYVSIFQSHNLKSKVRIMFSRCNQFLILMRDSPDSTVQTAAKALILSACISLWEHSTSNHMSRKPMPSRVMYINSDIIDNHRTPVRRGRNYQKHCRLL